MLGFAPLSSRPIAALTAGIVVQATFVVSIDASAFFSKVGGVGAVSAAVSLVAAAAPSRVAVISVAGSVDIDAFAGTSRSVGILPMPATITIDGTTAFGVPKTTSAHGIISIDAGVVITTRQSQLLTNPRRRVVYSVELYPSTVSDRTS